MLGSNPALVKKCPKWGHVFLTTPNGKTWVAETSCKTWRCKVCRTKMLAYVEARIAAGIIQHGNCLLITVTLRWDGETNRDAEYVQARWRGLLYRLKSRGLWKTGTEWFRVIELTKNNQPHLHLILTSQKQRSRCYSADGIDAKTYKKRLATCGCVAHTWARIWLEVTGDSYIVDVQPIITGGGTARYLAKYLTKAADNQEGMEALGFKRKYSTSRKWPGGRMRFKISKAAGGKGFASVQFTPGTTGKFFMANGYAAVDHLERASSNIVVEVMAKNKAKATMKGLVRFIDVNHDNDPQVFSSAVHGRT